MNDSVTVQVKYTGLQLPDLNHLIRNTRRFNVTQQLKTMANKKSAQGGHEIEVDGGISTLYVHPPVLPIAAVHPMPRRIA